MIFSKKTIVLLGCAFLLLGCVTNNKNHNARISHYSLENAQKELQAELGPSVFMYINLMSDLKNYEDLIGEPTPEDLEEKYLNARIKLLKDTVNNNLRQVKHLGGYKEEIYQDIESKVLSNKWGFDLNHYILLSKYENELYSANVNVLPGIYKLKKKEAPIEQQALLNLLQNIQKTHNATVIRISRGLLQSRYISDVKEQVEEAYTLNLINSYERDQYQELIRKSSRGEVYVYEKLLSNLLLRATSKLNEMHS